MLIKGIYSAISFSLLVFGFMIRFFFNLIHFPIIRYTTFFEIKERPTNLSIEFS
jgi:hypothetical protein